MAAAASSQVSNAVQAADRGNFASRLSHSCGPNCRNVAGVVAGSRITNALFTVEDIAAGEELCWDYACVTESEREYRAAICLCATPACRGSFLYYANSTTFQGVNISQSILLPYGSEAGKSRAHPVRSEQQSRRAMGTRLPMLAHTCYGTAP